jgi:hypothetical protein
VLGNDLDSDEPPEYNPAAGIAWQAFDELSPLRSVGFAGGERLALTEVAEYGRVFLGLDDQEDLTAFARMVFVLDDAFITRVREKSEKTQPASRRKPAGRASAAPRRR